MGGRRLRSIHTTSAILGATAMALVASPAAADVSPSTRAFPEFVGLSKPTPQLALVPETGLSQPRELPTARTSQTYVVKAGDTVWALAQKFGTTVAKIIDANGLNASAMIRVGQTLIIPGPSSGAPEPSPPSPGAPSTVPATHTVRAGETLSAIAATYKTTTAQLVSLNNISNPNFIRVGQVLKLPGSSPTNPAPPSSPGTPSTPTPPSAPSPSGTTYTVKAGDTVWSIAVAHNVTVSAIISANGLRSDAFIRVGQVLQIPGGSSTPSEPTPNACKDLVPSTFLHYTYPADVVAAANENKCTLEAMDVPSREAMQRMVRETAVSMGVNPSLAQAVAFQESGFNHRSVSPANAIGTMQVIPSSGVWAGQLLGRSINLLDPQDNVAAGVAILRSLQRTFPDNLDYAIGSYYQGAGSVSRYGLASDTRNYVNAVKAHMARFN